MKSLWLSTLEWCIQPSFLLDRPHVPGLTPGLAFCLLPLWLGPSFSLSILPSPSRAWKSAHKPKRAECLEPANCIHTFYSIAPDYTSKCHLFPHCSVPEPSFPLPMPILFAWVLACHLPHSSATSSSVWPASLDFLKFLPWTVQLYPLLLVVSPATANNSWNHSKRHSKP